MRAYALVTAVAFVLGCGAAGAQSDSDTSSPAEPATPTEAPLPEKILAPPSPESAPTVTIRNVDNGDRVEEYREHGRITMVKVTPQRGAPYTLLDINGDGKLDRRDSEGPVAPIYWTLYEWN